MSKKLSERQVEILTEGSKARGYKRKRDRGEGPAIAWLVTQERIAQGATDVYHATEAGKKALADHKAAAKKRAA